MYDFIDTIDNPIGRKLPSEALKINGSFIEEQIPEYRTLYVYGREVLSPEIESQETGIRDGSDFKSRRYPARVITVGYQLITDSNTRFRSAYNELCSILNVEDAELIFNDELDKYFTGTPSEFGEVKPGTNAITSEFDILCMDPFKYSVKEYEVVPVLDGGKTFVIDYKGTYKSYPTLETDFYIENETSDDGESEIALTGNGDCGYVAFFDESGNIIQLGDPEDEDTESYAKSQTLVNQSFKTATSWGTSAKALWKTNSGITSSSSVVQAGSAGLAKPSSDLYYLKAANYGSGASYHGPSVTRTLPVDVAGETGAENFTFTYSQKMCIGSSKDDIKQCGAFQVHLVSGSGSERKIFAGISVFKSASGKTAKLRFYINGKTVYTMDIDLSYHNKRFGANQTADTKKKLKEIKTVKTSSIIKSGETVTFTIGGTKKVFRDSAIADMKVSQVTFVFAQYKTKPALAYNGIYWAKFVKNNCTTWRDIPNKFGSNDVVKADCKDGKIYLNDVESPEYGALGNDWEKFYLTNGINQIGVAYSDWLQDEYAPVCKVRYREVFL